MPERFRERLLRNVMPRSAVFQTFAFLTSLYRPKVQLPLYVAPDQPFPVTARKTAGAPVITTSRFRTGSTLLWQCFLRLGDFTAYYEPFNDRQWFSPEKRGDQVDASHRGVEDYARNYDGLTDLSDHYQIDWINRRLAMGATDADRHMVAFIKLLIESAPGQPVLQFNRIDFRLGFLKEKFPEASFLYLGRNPRDTWLSTLRGVDNDPSWTLMSYQPYCRFYLLEWYRDLILTFPWLFYPAQKTHPYQLHYMLHRLSELFARRYCDVFMQYEDMETDLVKTLDAALDQLGHANRDLSAVAGLSQPRARRYDHSSHQSFYEEQESRVEEQLRRVLGIEA